MCTHLFKEYKIMSRVIAFYLPQFHPIPENDEWWGKGYTEWVNVAKAKPLFRGHHQPNIPADLGFYDLRLPETRIAQADMARKHGIEGFCYWHYWFGNGKRLLERPFNEVINSGEPDFPFCLAWANHSWFNKTWDKNGTDKLLIEQKYPGEQDYIDHFNTLLPAFKDHRYMTVSGKLLFFIYQPDGSPDIPKFMKIWRDLAQQNGLNNFYFVARDADSRCKDRNIKLGFDAIYNDDVFNIHHHLNLVKKISFWITREMFHLPTLFSYKKAIDYMVSDDCKDNKVIPVIAPNWDHSPRSGGKAILLYKSAPRYFYKVVRRAIDIVKNKPEDEQLVIIKSWNEWGEGNYLEPDIENGDKYLLALKDALIEAKNFQISK